MLVIYKKISCKYMSNMLENIIKAIEFEHNAVCDVIFAQ